MADYMYAPRPSRRSARYNDYDRDDYYRKPRYASPEEYYRPRAASFDHDRDFREPPRDRRPLRRPRSPPGDYLPRRRPRSLERDPPPRRPRSPPRSQYQRPRNTRRQSSSMDAPRRRHSPPPPRRSSSLKNALGNQKVQHATKSAFNAGAMEAIRLRGQPGQWAGPKGARVATAALGAAATDTIADNARDGDQGDSKRHLVESTIGGLFANRAINGSKDWHLGGSKKKKESRDHESRDHRRRR